MNLTKDQISKIISIVIMAAVALLAVFGYDVGIVQPEFRTIRGEQPQAVGSQAVLGPYFESLNVGKNFKSLGTAEMNSATVTTLTATTLMSQSVGFDTTGNGTAAAPVYTFASDPDTGLYRVGANDVGVSTGGTLAFDVSATAATSALPVVVPAGSVTAPALTFASDTDSGLYRIGANNIGVTAAGAKVLDVSASGLGVVGVTSIGNGTVSLPGLAFTSDPDSGLYRIGANDIGIATNGVLAADVSASAVTLALPAVNAVGSAAAPSVTFTGDTDTGLYRVGANDVGVATNGALAMDVSATTTTFATKVMGSATEATALFNTTVELTVTQIVNGATVVTVPAGRQFRLVAAKAVATGATCTTSTSVDIVANTTHLVVFTTANLVRSTVLTDGGTGATVLADGASYLAQTAGQDITIIGVTGTTAGCTSVIFILTYALD